MSEFVFGSSAAVGEGFYFGGLGAGAPGFDYSIGGFNPELVADFENSYFRSGGTSDTSLSHTLDHTRNGNATMVDSDGLLKWGPHNLALNSATPATQSITVVSGADYMVECTGSGSITLSGAGTGSVTEGSPVEVTASTTSLTLTVVGSVDLMWCYRSDLGGMVNNPDRGDSYVPTTSAARYLPRVNHHVYNGSAWVNKGLLMESEARTNLFLNSSTLSTQGVTTTAQAYTVSFTGTGTITFSGDYTGSLVGTGTGENNRVSVTFTPTAGTVTCTVSGTVSNAQFEAASTPSSYIPTNGATVTRAAETLTVPAANLPWNPLSVSIQMQGEMTYADEGVTAEIRFFRWLVDGSNYIFADYATDGAFDRMKFEQSTSGTVDNVQNTSAPYSPGVNVPFNIASRHGSTFINGAVDGTALTANTTPTALPDLSATDLQLAYDYMGTISLFRIWADDLGDAGIAEASSLSLTPSLSLTFDGQTTSFTDTGMVV